MPGSRALGLVLTGSVMHVTVMNLHPTKIIKICLFWLGQVAGNTTFLPHFLAGSSVLSS